MKTLFITGISGLLGEKVAKLANPKFIVHGSYFKNAVQVDGVKSHFLDLTNFSEVQNFFEEIEPEIVIHTAAVSDPNQCEKQPEYSDFINVQSTIKLSELCRKIGSKFLFTSTDLVFDGKEKFYSESDFPNPVNLYAQQKLNAENLIEKNNPDAIICRLPLLFGEQGANSNSFIQPMINKLLNGRELLLFEDEYRTPISTEWASKIILKLLDQQGIFHLPGPQRVSRVEIGKALCEILNKPISSIKSVFQSQVSMPAKRPADVSLSTNKIKALVQEQPSLMSQLMSLNLN